MRHMAHIPIRECIACGRKFPKSEMLRIVEKDGVISIDFGSKAEGRGAYICANPSCRQTAMERRKLNRAFRKNVPETVYESIREELENAGE